jgi:hypothetical protein
VLVTAGIAGLDVGASVTGACGVKVEAIVTSACGVGVGAAIPAQPARAKTKTGPISQLNLILHLNKRTRALYPVANVSCEYGFAYPSAADVLLI